jgi:LmbE family N-acetylglucosaminyl deacetylase
MSERVLAFGCHPDDVEIMCSGTLALLADAGYEIHIATMTGGEVGSTSLPPQEIRRVRVGEAREAAELIGGTYHYAGGHDLEVTYNDEYRQRTVAVVREVRPHIVFTHPPMDYMIDHEETSRLVRTAAFIASIPSYDCGLPLAPTEGIPYLYYWNAIDLTDIFGRPIPVSFGVDVTEKMDVKRKTLACHASQREWLRYINGWDAYISNMEDYTRRQGTCIGAAFGECFAQHVAVPHPSDNVLQSVLADAVRATIR